MILGLKEYGKRLNIMEVLETMVEQVMHWARGEGRREEKK